MGVQRVEVVAVIENDQVPIPLNPPRIDHVAGSDGDDPRPFAGLDVDSPPERPGAEARVHLLAEGAHDPPIGGPRQ